ncbi:hypothetical protein GSU68_14960 [Rathayibacter sp. VKM Ac-2759]|nr:hypothetical protein GSU68_14960 [Rathayibacter sp. VKM Ac-2759]
MLEAVAALAGWGAGAVLVVSGALKLGRAAAFRDSLVVLGLPALLTRSPLFARALPFGEILLGAAVVLAPAPAHRVALAAAALVFAVFLVVAMRASRAPEPVDCECFGGLGESRMSGRTVARNALLLALALAGLAGPAAAALLGPVPAATAASGLAAALIAVVLVLVRDRRARVRRRRSGRPRARRRRSGGVRPGRPDRRPRAPHLRGAAHPPGRVRPAAHPPRLLLAELPLVPRAGRSLPLVAQRAARGGGARAGLPRHPGGVRRARGLRPARRARALRHRPRGRRRAREGGHSRSRPPRSAEPARRRLDLGRARDRAPRPPPRLPRRRARRPPRARSGRRRLLSRARVRHDGRYPGRTEHRMTLGSLTTAPASERLDLLAEAVLAGAERDGLLDELEVVEIDAADSDTAVTKERYGLEDRDLANCVVVAGSRTGQERIAACVVLADSRADVNGAVRRLLDVRKASFLPMERAVDESGMEYGGITPIGLPGGWRLLIDERVLERPAVVIGSGVRRSKIVLPGAVLARLAGAEVVAGLGLVP